MGTCYVTIPQVNQDPSWAGTSYLTQPTPATVSLYPGTGTSVDLTDTSPRPADQQPYNGVYQWTCSDYSHLESGGLTGQCPAIAVIAAGWSVSYPQVTLLVVGALIAIAAERWFRIIHPEEPGEEKKAAGHGGNDEDTDPPPGDDKRTPGTGVAPPDSPKT